MPWSLSVNYSFNISEDRSKPINVHSMRYPFSYTHNLNASGNVKLSNRWQVSFSTGYDFQAKEVTQTSMTITRDLHCSICQPVFHLSGVGNIIISKLVPMPVSCRI